VRGLGWWWFWEKLCVCHVSRGPLAYLPPSRMSLSKHDRQISELATIIAAIEARLAHAKQDHGTAESTPKCVHTLFRLPTELLVRVASLTIRAECDINITIKHTIPALMSLCHHLYGRGAIEVLILVEEDDWEVLKMLMDALILYTSSEY
jgi:hypothetical protein